MMSGLKTPEGIFLDLIYLAETGSGFMGRRIPKSIFIDYLKLTDSYESLKYQTDHTFEGITKEKFQKEYPTESWPDIDQKIDVFSRKLHQFESDDDAISNYHQYEDESIKNAYQYYHYCTGHKDGQPISTKMISDRDSAYMMNMMKSIGEDILLRETLQNVQDQLVFKEKYTSTYKELLESTGPACSKEYFKMFNGEDPVNGEELMQRVLERYNFKIYADSSVKKAMQDSKKAVREWIRRRKMEDSGFFIK